jgi:hypothetical protein
VLHSAPIGGNYHIKNSGTFLLSSGFIEQKQWSINSWFAAACSTASMYISYFYIPSKRISSKQELSGSSLLLCQPDRDYSQLPRIPHYHAIQKSPDVPALELIIWAICCRIQFVILRSGSNWRLMSCLPYLCLVPRGLIESHFLWGRHKIITFVMFMPQNVLLVAYLNFKPGNLEDDGVHAGGKN